MNSRLKRVPVTTLQIGVAAVGLLLVATATARAQEASSPAQPPEAQEASSPAKPPEAAIEQIDNPQVFNPRAQFSGRSPHPAALPDQRLSRLGRLRCGWAQDRAHPPLRHPGQP